MQTQTLDGDAWQARPMDTQDWLPAHVPGDIHTDLLAAGKIPDPFYGTNERRVQWVAEKSWEYRRFFYPLPALLRHEHVWLVCDGLDTLAEVRLNGKILGQTENMFRAWRWEVKERLLEGENKLEILFRSPVRYARARARARRLGEMGMGIRGGAYLRKAPYQFGWDWGPRLPGMGIHKSIRLEGYSRGMLGEIRFTQEHTRLRLNGAAWQINPANALADASDQPAQGYDSPRLPASAPPGGEPEPSQERLTPIEGTPLDVAPAAETEGEVRQEESLRQESVRQESLRQESLRASAGDAPPLAPEVLQPFAPSPSDWQPAVDARTAVTLTARVSYILWEQTETPFTIRLRLTGPDRQVWQLDAPARAQPANRAAVLTVTIPNPRLWWPHGYGAPDLYHAEIELLDGGGTLLDARALALGLRTVELRCDDCDERQPARRSFTFVVNGQPIFCKGANWVPADSFPARISPGRVTALIDDAAAAHFNMLRVWGGGYYETDAFYEACDQAGLLIWQDFPFACAAYPLDDPPYLENVRAEVLAAVARLRHHACLALWCGNNEIEMLGGSRGWHRGARLREAYRCFFFDELPHLLAEHDPEHPYWPGSPSSNTAFQDPNSPERGDAHLWDVFSGFRPAADYRRHDPAFVSEFGFQGLPAAATLAEIAPPAAQRLGSAEMRAHQRAWGGSERLVWYLTRRFPLPKRWDDLRYLTQVMQAEAVRVGVEHWRRHPDRTSGTLYWQLNDCWPVISWSSIDYAGRWKALHYAARRFYAPLLLSVDEQVEQGARRAAVWLVNDQAADWQGRVQWSLETLRGEVITGGDQPTQAAPRSAKNVLLLDFAQQSGKLDWRAVVLVTEVWQGADCLSRQVTPFAAEKDMPLEDPRLTSTLRVRGDALELEIHAAQLARFVEISLEGADCIFSDNFFDLPAGRAVTVTTPLPAGWDAAQAQSALRLRALNTPAPRHNRLYSAARGGLALAASLLDLFWQGVVKG